MWLYDLLTLDLGKMFRAPEAKPAPQPETVEFELKPASPIVPFVAPAPKAEPKPVQKQDSIKCGKCHRTVYTWRTYGNGNRECVPCASARRKN